MEQENGWAVLRVRATGIGIAPDVLPHILDLFVLVAHTDARSRDGSGIGFTLYIAARQHAEDVRQKAAHRAKFESV